MIVADAIFFYEPFSDFGLFSGGDWRFSTPLENLIDPDIGRVARSTDAAATSTVIDVDLGRGQLVGGVVAGPINISNGAQWQITAFDDADHATVIYTSGLQTTGGTIVESTDLEWEDPGFWDGNPDYTDDDGLPFYAYHVVASGPILSQYWRVEIIDENNADGYIQIGRLMICRAWQPSHNYDYGDNPISLEPLFDVSESLGGREDYWERGMRRTWRCVFSQLPLPEDELFSDVLRMMLRSGAAGQMFVVPDSDDNVSGRRRSFLCRYKQIPSIQQIMFGLGSTAFDLKEVL